MSIARQLPLPDLPTGIDPTLRQPLQALFNRLGDWITAATKQLGQFQRAPVSPVTPQTGQVLAFDGTVWIPSTLTAGGGGGAGIPPLVPLGLFFNTQILGTKDSHNVNFTTPFTLGIDSLGAPMAMVLWKTGPLVYVTGPPQYGQWAFAPPNNIILGVAPEAGDDLVMPIAVEA